MPDLTNKLTNKTETCEVDRDEAQTQLLESLNYLQCSAEFRSINEERYATITGSPAASIAVAYAKLKSETGNNFHCNIPLIEIPVLNKKLNQHHPTIIIGGVITGDKKSITRSSFAFWVTFQTEGLITPGDSCCRVSQKTGKRIVRKFHFDLQPGNQKIPPSHLQYGGNPPNSIPNGMNSHYCLEPFLENPRIQYFPMDYLLVLDLALREFDTPLNDMVEERSWNNLVSKSQKVWWVNYVSLVNAVMAKDKCCLHEIAYQ